MEISRKGQRTVTAFADGDEIVIVEDVRSNEFHLNTRVRLSRLELVNIAGNFFDPAVFDIWLKEPKKPEKWPPNQNFSQLKKEWKQIKEQKNEQHNG